MATEPGPRRSLLLAAALAVTISAYARAPQGGFVWDDRVLIVEPLGDAQAAAGPPSLLAPFWRDAGARGPVSFFRPLTEATYRLDWAISGGEAGWFHLLNLVLHLGCVALVFHLIARRGGSTTAAGLGAALFGLAPRATESVAWISGRTDVLACLFVLGAFAVHTSEPTRLARRWSAAALLFLGLLSKEVAAVGLAGIVASEALAWRKGGWARAARGAAPALAALTLYLVLRRLGLGGQEREHLAIPWAARVAVPFEALGRYLLMLADPFRPRLQIGFLGHPDPGAVALGIAALAGLAVAAARAFRSGLPAAETAQVLAAGGSAVVLVLHLVPFRTSIVAADRFLYLPLAALAIASGRSAPRLAPGARRVAALVALAAIPLSALATWQRVGDWIDEERLWSAAAATAHPLNGLPWNELGNVQFRAGRYQEAITSFRRAAATGGVFAIEGLAGESNALSEMGRLEEARTMARRVVGEEPGLAPHHYNLAIIEARQLDFDAAEAEARAALAIQPAYGAARRLLEQLAPLRSLASSLPLPRPSESLDVVTRRARLLGRVGREVEAIALYGRVAAAPDAAPGDALEAARYLVAHGSSELARMAIERARQLGVDEGTLTRLAGARNPRAKGQAALPTGSDLSGPRPTSTPEIPGR